MLTAKRIPKACTSCRFDLLNLYRYGFVAAPQNIKHARSLSFHRLAVPSNRNKSFPQNRSLTSSSARPEDASPGKPQSQRPLEDESLNPLKEASPLASHELEEGELEDLFEGLETEEIPHVSDPIEAEVRQARRTFGATLPKDYLTDEEYVVYERLYGAPLRETRGSDLEFLDHASDTQRVDKRRSLLMQDADGETHEIDLGEYEDQAEGQHLQGADSAESALEQVDEDFYAMGLSERETEAIVKLRNEMPNEPAEEVVEEGQVESEAEEDIDEDAVSESMEDSEDAEQEDYVSGDSVRTHPHTLAGRWGTKPSTVSLPRMDFVLPISELLKRTKSKHLLAAAEKAFGGPGLPYSASTPQSAKQIQQKHIGLEAAQYNMSDIEADAYMAAVMPATYAMAMGTLIETRKRLGTKWLRDLLLREGGPRFLDAGAGGAALIAWRQIVQAEWDLMFAEGLVHDKYAPEGQSSVLTGPNTLRYRMSRFLDDTTFLPRLPDYVHSQGSERLLDGSEAYNRKYYDVIVAPHTLLPLKEDYRRKTQINNLWYLTEAQGGVLTIIEKGIPRGFEAVAGARSLLLKRRIASPNETYIDAELQAPDSEDRHTEKETGMIVAPCTNHTACPMYKMEGTSMGRKDYCHFEQRYIRPPFLQRLLGASGKNHEDVKFSYITIRRGVDNRDHAATAPVEGLMQGENATLAALKGYEATGDTRNASTEADADFYPLALPRAILPPIKRTGHVTLDLCTPSGTIERWTVPRSFSTQAYRDARKSSHGDLWALGAKTRTLRNIRLGRPYTAADGKKKTPRARGGELGGSLRQGEVRRDEWMQKQGRKGTKDVFEVDPDKEGVEGVKYKKKRGVDRFEKRTKGGRLPGRERVVREQDLFGMDDLD